MQRRLQAGVHEINRLGCLIHQEATFLCIPYVAASGFNMAQVPACLSGSVHHFTTSLSYLSLGIYCRHLYNSVMILGAHTILY